MDATDTPIFPGELPWFETEALTPEPGSLSQPETHVRTWCPINGLSVAVYTKDGRWHEQGGFFMWTPPTHWRYLGKPNQ